MNDPSESSATSSQTRPGREIVSSVEPWLRGTLTHLDSLRRQVLHALELTSENIQHWCAPLTDAEIDERPYSLPSIAFQIRHISRSLDRLLTYAEGRQLSAVQLGELATESLPHAGHAELFAEFNLAIQTAQSRLLSVDPDSYEVPRGVGRARLPTTVGSLLIHCAEHTQRHTGQAITTAKIILAMRSDPETSF